MEEASICFKSNELTEKEQILDVDIRINNELKRGSLVLVGEVEEALCDSTFEPNPRIKEHMVYTATDGEAFSNYEQASIYQDRLYEKEK
jgi:hypothetical protein